MPRDQCRLLQLWDELGIPHKPHKQLSGAPLTIIGIDVDPNLMTLSLPDDAKDRLLEELCFWASKPPKNASGSFKLKHWERLAGWFNWALNVYPLLRPALNNVYAKMAGKQNRDQHLYINNAIRDDLMWAVSHIEHSGGIHLLKSFNWTPAEADFVIYCDACPEGMGFWYPVSKDGYYTPTPVNVPTDVIFYYETLCVLSAIVNVQTKAPAGSKVLIYTDNANTVDIFRSLRCLPAYNHLLKAAVDVLIANDYSLLFVFYIFLVMKMSLPTHYLVFNSQSLLHVYQSLNFSHFIPPVWWGCQNDSKSYQATPAPSDCVAP